jgi:hypothetical protein
VPNVYVHGGKINAESLISVASGLSTLRVCFQLAWIASRNHCGLLFINIAQISESFQVEIVSMTHSEGTERTLKKLSSHSYGRRFVDLQLPPARVSPCMTLWSTPHRNRDRISLAVLYFSIRISFLTNIICFSSSSPLISHLFH